MRVLDEVLHGPSAQHRVGLDALDTLAYFGQEFLACQAFDVGDYQPGLGEMPQVGLFNPQIGRADPLPEYGEVGCEILYEALPRPAQCRIGGGFFDGPGLERLSAAGQPLIAAICQDNRKPVAERVPQFSEGRDRFDTR
ncbi:MAG: hypothetical protein BWY92_00850 [Firmicutes bacterium ADurb.BinA052]|nr:MAG: hypothetical protein BWY92_00850 [Firmicutes bacterium ADurb.BinA052]